MIDDLNDGVDQRSCSEDEGRNSDNNENEPINNDLQDDNEAAKRVDPQTSKKRIVRNPIPKLNPARLKGPKGVHTIEEYFKGFKFYGKGHEKHDLDRIMKRLEHWGHRLFPKYQFDDFLEKLETLGTKKELQTFLTRYRRDMMLDEVIIREEEDDAADEREKSPEPVDEFDLLIAEQIEKTKQASTTAETIQRNNDIFDSLLSSQNQKTLNNSQQVNNSESNTTTESEEEIKKKIERNRQLAIERRQAKLRQNEQIKRDKVSRSSIITPENEVAVGVLQSSNNLLQTDESISNVQMSATNNKEQTPTLTDEEINSIFNSDTQPMDFTDNQNPEVSDESQQHSCTVENNLNSKNAPKPLLTDEELERQINEAVNQFAQHKKQLHST